MYPFGRPAHQPPGNLPNRPSQPYHQASYKDSPPPPPPSGLSPLPIPLLPASPPAGPSSQTIPTTNNITGTSFSNKGPTGPTGRRPFALTPDTSIEFETFSLPSHAEIFWKVFRPTGPSSSNTLPAITSQTTSSSELSSLAALEAARKWTVARYITPAPVTTNSDICLDGLNILTSSLIGHLLPSLPASKQTAPQGTSFTSNQNTDIQEDSPQSSEGGRPGNHHEPNVDAEFWLFAVDAEKDHNKDSTGLAALLKDVSFQGLEEHACGSFHPSTLYPSGISAALSPDVPSTIGALYSLMPDPKFRRAYSVFLLAARERIIEQLTSPSSESIKSQGIRVVRCARGVVLLPWDCRDHARHGWKRGNDWGSGWGVRPGERRPWDAGSTVYITFSLHLLPAPHNLVLFVPHPTRIPFTPFNLPLINLTPVASPVPVRLLPTGTLAYFLRASNQMDTDRGKQAERTFWEALHSPSVGLPPEIVESGWAVCWVPIGKSAEDIVGEGVVCCWPVELMLSSTSPDLQSMSKPTASSSARKVSSSLIDHSIGSGLGSKSGVSKQIPMAQSLPSFGSSSATALPTSNLASIWKTLTSASSRHYASSFPATPPSSPAPSGANQAGSAVTAEGPDDQSRVVDPQDIYFEIASSGVRYLDSLVREKEKERERQEEERENEKRRKDAAHPGSVTAGVGYFGMEPEGEDPGSDDLWGSDSGGDVGQAVDTIGKTVSTPSLHLPTMASSTSAALHQAIQRNTMTPTVLPTLSSRKSAEQPGSLSQSTGFTPLSVQEQQIAAADLGHLMDWSWDDPAATASTSTNTNADIGPVPPETLGSVNTPNMGLTPQSSSTFNLRLSSHRRQTEEPSWAPVDAVTEDDFDFFDAPGTGATPGASFLSNEAPPELSLMGVMDRQQSLGLSPTAGIADTSFGLSPLPSHMIGLTGSGAGVVGNAGAGTNGPFSPVLMDVDLVASGSPNNNHLIQGPLNQASPSGSSIYAVHSPGSSAWTHGLYQQAKTPKTPFSPFVEIEEDEHEIDEAQTKANRTIETGTIKQEEVGHPLDSIEHISGAASKVRNSGLIPAGFEPVPFGRGHTLADGKYELGKFAFPSPVSLVSSEGEGSVGAIFSENEEARGAKKRRSSEMTLYKTKKSGSWKEHLASDNLNKSLSHTSTFSSRRTRRTTEPRDSFSLPTPNLLADLRVHYNQIADPRVGVIRRLKSQSFSHRNRSTPLQAQNEARLPSDFKRQLRLSTPNHRFERSMVEDESETDDEWDIEDLLGFKNWTFTSPSLKDDQGATEDETDALRASIDFLPYLVNGMYPSSSAGVSFSLVTYHQSSHCGERTSVHTLNDGSSAQTPLPQQSQAVAMAAAATTPAWAPTPTSPPFGSAAKETTDEDIEILGAWLAREAVENSLLIGELKLKLRSSVNTLSHNTFSWDAEPVSSVLDILRAKSSKPLHTLQSLAELHVTPSAVSSPCLETLQSPKFTIVCQGNIMKTSPLALRFWPKLGLAPAGGQKDVVAFAIYESTGPGMNSKVGAWLAKAGAMYESMGLGKHSAGSAAGFQHGLVAVDNTHLLESIYPIVTEMDAVSHVVFYLITPRHLSSTSFSLRDIHSQLSTALSTLQSSSSISRFLTHVVPTPLVLDEPNQAHDQLSLSAVCLSVYDRLQRNVNRLVPRQLFESKNITKSFRFPAFYISKPRPPSAEFSLSWPPSSLNVSDKHMFLHLAYGFSPNRDWLVACAVDERGQAHELKVWRMSRETFSFDWAVFMLWGFFIKFGGQADVEWRMVIGKLGLMEPSEINAWEQHLSNQLSTLAVSIQVHLTCADPSSPPPFLSGIPSSNDHTSFEESLAHSLSRFDGSDSFVDTSNTTFGIYPSYRIPYILSSFDNVFSSYQTPLPMTTPVTISSNPDFTDLQESILPLSNFSILRVSSLSSINSLSSSASSRTISNLTIHHLLTIASPSSSAPPFSHLDHSSDFRRDLAENMHSLSVLARERWGEWDPPLGDHLPLHLLAVARMCAVVDLVKRGEYGL